MRNPIVGIIGAGPMGSSLYKACAARLGAERVIVCDRNPEKLEKLNPGRKCADPAEILAEADVIFLAIKPQAFDALVPQLKGLTPDALLVSVMAGIAIARVQSATGARKIIRAMPNLAMQFGKGVIVWIASSAVTAEEKNLARAIWNSAGFEIEVKDESLLDATVALSGSGPAYFFHLCELLQEKAKEYGFSEEAARKIAENTFTGAAFTLDGSGQSAQKLREAVTSKAGTTAAVFEYLREHNFDSIFKQAIEKARRRSEELSGKNPEAESGSARSAKQTAAEAVSRAQEAFRVMGQIADQQVTTFFELAAKYLEDEARWQKILKVNEQDERQAKARGRSTTRLTATDDLRREMIAGLKEWAALPSRRGEVVERVEHKGWKVELKRAELGVVGFVFEGRPNVVVDAVGVLRGGNTVVFRIGRDALNTARAIMAEVVRPALLKAGLPEGAVVLVESEAHETGQALIADKRLALAVVRGSGAAVRSLGALARQAGVPVSLHGTGGAWMVAGQSADLERLESCVEHSLDRKVCNTLNTICIVRARASDAVPSVLSALTRAGQRLGQNFKLHVVEGSEKYVPRKLFEKRVAVFRARGLAEEPQAESLKQEEIGREWEWEQTPEVTLCVLDDLDQAIELFNKYSPRFVACLISENKIEQEDFYQRVDAPFVSDGFTRWVDGLYALGRPELGLSNWQSGRLLGRGAILSGDSVYTIRARASQSDPQVRR